MAKYNVIEPFKDSAGQHRPGEVLDDIDHAETLVNAGLIVEEPEPEETAAESEPQKAEPSEPEQEQPTEPPVPKPQKAEPMPSKKPRGKRRRKT